MELPLFFQASRFLASIPSFLAARVPATKPIIPGRMNVAECSSFSIKHQTKELTRPWLAVNLTWDEGSPSHVATLEMDSIMKWKLKAFIQNTVAYLPDETSYSMYYWIQRHFGGLRRVNPTRKLQDGINTWKRILQQNQEPTGKVFFEVGTGRMPLVPMAFWLMGAGSTITVDLNPYMKEELVRESLQYLAKHREPIAELFGSLLDTARFASLLDLAQRPSYSLADVLEHCQIKYIAPGDAAKTDLSGNRIDYHTSYTVFEHIPREILHAILTEGNRLMRPGGLFVHRIDYSDHFSHSDKSISAINFLQFNEKSWDKYAGNRYMYQNRLRHDDYLQLFESVGQRLLATEPDRNPKLAELVQSGALALDDRFKSKPADILSITGSWIVTEKG